MATSPRKSSTPKKSIRTGSAKPRKSVKLSTKCGNRDETPDKSTQEAQEQLKVKKPTSRKSVKVMDFGEKETRGAMPVTTFRTLAHVYS